MRRVAGRESDFPQASRNSLSSQNLPELPQKFPGDFPGTSLTVDFKSNAEVPGGSLASQKFQGPGPPQRLTPLSLKPDDLE